MSALNNGGPAFPGEATMLMKPGMALRDYLAAKAMVVIWSNLDAASVRSISVTQTARTAYDLADAMLLARDKR